MLVPSRIVSDVNTLLSNTAIWIHQCWRQTVTSPIGLFPWLMVLRTC